MSQPPVRRSSRILSRQRKLDNTSLTTSISSQSSDIESSNPLSNIFLPTPNDTQTPRCLTQEELLENTYNIEGSLHTQQTNHDICTYQSQDSQQSIFTQHEVDRVYDEEHADIRDVPLRYLNITTLFPSNQNPRQVDYTNDLPQIHTLYLFKFDGASSSKEGEKTAGCGVAIYKPIESITQTRQLHSIYGKSLGSSTNNEAEYEGFLLCIQKAKDLELTHILLEGDSSLVINQIASIYQCKAPNLQEKLKNVRNFDGRFQYVGIRHLLREYNQVADIVAKTAADIQSDFQYDDFESFASTINIPIEKKEKIFSAPLMPAIIAPALSSTQQTVTPPTIRTSTANRQLIFTPPQTTVHPPPVTNRANQPITPATIRATNRIEQLSTPVINRVNQSITPATTSRSISRVSQTVTSAVTNRVNQPVTPAATNRITQHVTPATTRVNQPVTPATHRTTTQPVTPATTRSRRGGPTTMPAGYLIDRIETEGIPVTTRWIARQGYLQGYDETTLYHALRHAYKDLPISVDQFKAYLRPIISNLQLSNNKHLPQEGARTFYDKLFIQVRQAQTESIQQQTRLLTEIELNTQFNDSSISITRLSDQEFIHKLHLLGKTNVYATPNGRQLDEERAAYITLYQRILHAVETRDQILALRRCKEYQLFNHLVHPPKSQDNKVEARITAYVVIFWAQNDMLDKVTLNYLDTYINTFHKKIYRRGDATRQANAARNLTSNTKKLGKKINQYLTEGLITKSFQLLQPQNTVAFTEATKQLLREKFPQTPPLATMRNREHDITITEEPPHYDRRERFSNANVRQSILKLSKKTHPGHTGLRPEHLKALQNSLALKGDLFLDHYAKYCHCLFYGLLPQAYYNMLTQLVLINIPKESSVAVEVEDELVQTTDIRPLSMYVVDLKIVEATSVRFDSEAINDKLGLLSTATRRGGIEYNGFRLLLASLNRKAILTTDKVNAYGRVNRWSALKATSIALPDWKYYCKVIGDVDFKLIHKAPDLSLFNIDMVTGIFQGAAASNVYYSLEDLESIKRLDNVARMSQSYTSPPANGEVNGACAFLDDTVLITDTSNIHQAACEIFNEITTAGGQLSTGANKSRYLLTDNITQEEKATVISAIAEAYQITLAQAETMMRYTNDPDTEKQGIKTLGRYYGSNDFLMEKLNSVMTDDNASLLKSLNLILNPAVSVQAAWIYVRHIFMNKLTYLLRGHHPDYTKGPAVVFFNKVMKVLSEKLGTSFQQEHILQMQLPVEHGGMGLPNFEEEALSAFLSSSIQFLATVKHEEQVLDTEALIEHILPLVREWCLLAEVDKNPRDFINEYLESTPQQLANLQAKLTQPLKKKRLKRFQDEVIPQLPRERQQAFRLIAKGDSSWLVAMPVGNCQFNNEEFRVSFLNRLRIPLPMLQSMQNKRCYCKTQNGQFMEVDNNGDHLLTCKYIKGSDRTIMHDNVVRFLSALDRKARIQSEIEPRGKYVAVSHRRQPQGPRDNRLLADLLSHDQILNNNGQPTLGDISGTHGISSAGDISLEMVLQHRAQQKVTKYEAAVNEIGCNFRPLIFETISAGRHKDLEDFIQSRSQLIAQRTGVEVGNVAFRNKQELTCIIRKDVARTVINRLERLQNKNEYYKNFNQDLYDQLTTKIENCRFSGLAANWLREN